jgi:hypothetical protein
MPGGGGGGWGFVLSWVMIGGAHVPAEEGLRPGRSGGLGRLVGQGWGSSQVERAGQADRAEREEVFGSDFKWALVQ